MKSFTFLHRTVSDTTPPDVLHRTSVKILFAAWLLLHLLPTGSLLAQTKLWA